MWQDVLSNFSNTMQLDMLAQAIKFYRAKLLTKPSLIHKDRESLNDVIQECYTTIGNDCMNKSLYTVKWCVQSFIDTIFMEDSSCDLRTGIYKQHYNDEVICEFLGTMWYLTQSKIQLIDYLMCFNNGFGYSAIAFEKDLTAYMQAGRSKAHATKALYEIQYIVKEISFIWIELGCKEKECVTYATKQ